MLLTAGERISMALLAMAIRDEGVEAMSLTGSQAGILTDTSHGQAKIHDIKAFRVEERHRGGQGGDRRRVPGGVAGHQGDHHARAGAAPTPPRWRWPRRSHADACEIYTDVDGVFTADPRVVPEAPQTG